MLIEIRRAGFVNKGAELMLVAIISKLRSRYPEAKFCMAPAFGGSICTFEKMRDLHIYPRAWLWKYGINWLFFAKYLPTRLNRYYGIVNDKEIDVVIDAAGFAYSDQWGPLNSLEFASAVRDIKSRKAALILMPQAFGPFEGVMTKWAAKKWSNAANIVFAREKSSLEYIKPLVKSKDKIHLYPDFTNLIAGKGFNSRLDLKGKVALVPNYRMVDKTDESRGRQSYVEFFLKISSLVKDLGFEPFVLVHEGEDLKLCRKVAELCGSIPVVEVDDPLELKEIIGRCHATIGSRFHGLVSALSQGVPSLGTGWSHKYQKLFNDYGQPESLISVQDSDDVLQKKLQLLLESDSHHELSKKLIVKSSELKAQSERMWDLVFKEIDQAFERKKVGR